MKVYTFTDAINSQVERLFSSKQHLHYSCCNRDEYIDLIEESKDINPKLFHIAHTDNYRELFEEIIQYVSGGDCMIVSYPYADKCKKDWWKNIINDDRTGVTFDLYDLGIIFFDEKRVKENRIVNFL